MSFAKLISGLSLFTPMAAAPAPIDAVQVRAPAQSTAQLTEQCELSPDALDYAIAERNQLLRAGFSERYASASFLARLAAELPTQTGAKNMGRKLRSLAGQYMARELG